MEKVSIKKFSGYCDFMSDRVKVQSLEDGAIKYGGATRFPSNYYYSNIKSDSFITIKDNGTLNALSLFIPSKVGDKVVDNTLQVQAYTKALKEYFNTLVIPYNTSGSWYCEEEKKVIYEDICIITVYIEDVLREDIQYLIDLGKKLQIEMKQYCVSVYINNSLILV